MPGDVDVLAAVQHGREQVSIGAQIVEGPLAHVGAEIPNLVIDLLERQVEGKLPHPLDQALALVGDRVLLVRP